MTWSNSKRVYEALKNIDFLAVADIVITPTTSLADIILPSATPLESDAVMVGGLGMGDTYLQVQQKVVQTGECRTDLEIIISLANRLGLGEYFWKDLHGYLDSYLEESGITFDELRQRNHLISSGMEYRKYLKRALKHPPERWRYIQASVINGDMKHYHPIMNPERQLSAPLIWQKNSHSSSRARMIKSLYIHRTETLMFSESVTLSRLLCFIRIRHQDSVSRKEMMYISKAKGEG